MSDDSDRIASNDLQRQLNGEPRQQSGVFGHLEPGNVPGRRNAAEILKDWQRQVELHQWKKDNQDVKHEEEAKRLGKTWDPVTGQYF